MRIHLPGLLLLAITCTAGAQTPFAPPLPTAPTYTSDPKFVAAMAQAKQLKHEHQYSFAIDALRKANKAAAGACLPCLDQIFDLQMQTGDPKGAIATANQMRTLATTSLDQSVAEGKLGLALLRQAGDKPKPAQLEAAHTAFQAALTVYPKNNSARWQDACVLTQMGRLDEASKQFSTCADTVSATDPARIRARHFAQNPALSLAKMAPAFEVTALDGSRFNLDDMGGRVVLIDFWATWCGPCNAELPHIKKIAQEFAGQPLVILSISDDKDETTWKQFIAKHEMTWVQYRDADNALGKLFGVESIPHYFTIDSDGVLTSEMLGSGSNVEGKLKKLISRANESRQASATTVSGTQ